MKFDYKYRRKKYLMTQTESQFYDALLEILQDQYYIFPQVHLSSLLDHRIKGQSYKGALSHIQRKSVDFVVCDKSSRSPLVAIELDDKTHDRPIRTARDEEVEEIFKQADLPLLRFGNHRANDREHVQEQLQEVLSR